MAHRQLLSVAPHVSRLLKAIGNERRLRVLCHLSQGERSVNALCDLIGLSQSALSQHLAKLRKDQLVKTRREAQTIYYSLATPEVHKILEFLSDLYGSESGSEAPPRPEEDNQRPPLRRAVQ